MLERIGPMAMLDLLGDTHRRSMLKPPCYHDVWVMAAFLGPLNNLVSAW